MSDNITTTPVKARDLVPGQRAKFTVHHPANGVHEAYDVTWNGTVALVKQDGKRGVYIQFEADGPGRKPACHIPKDTLVEVFYPTTIANGEWHRLAEGRIVCRIDGGWANVPNGPKLWNDPTGSFSQGRVVLVDYVGDDLSARVERYSKDAPLGAYDHHQAAQRVAGAYADALRSEPMASKEEEETTDAGHSDAA